MDYEVVVVVFAIQQMLFLGIEDSGHVTIKRRLTNLLFLLKGESL